jgi:aspartyl/asparaginyl beta-hydroxylase (cupin superfamily)
MVFVSVDGRNVEGLSRAEIADVIKAASRPLKLVFRDPTAFFMQLNSSLPESDIFTDVRTVVKSAKVGDDGNIDAEEVLRVEKVEVRL